jgi:opacity protein-like surface antigen
MVAPRVKEGKTTPRHRVATHAARVNPRGHSGWQVHSNTRHGQSHKGEAAAYSLTRIACLVAWMPATRNVGVTVLRKASLIVMVLVACESIAGSVAAEWFGDLYLGGAFTQSHDLTANFTGFGIPTANTGLDVHFDASVVGGGRFGYWFNVAPYGFGLEVSHFQPNISPQTNAFTSNGVRLGTIRIDTVKLSVTEISFDLMLRWPGLIASPQYQNGRLQPYVSLGPAVFIATANDSTNFGPPNDQTKTDRSVGLKAGIGTTWLITQNMGVFGEYRFTHFSPEFEFQNALWSK